MYAQMVSKLCYIYKKHKSNNMLNIAYLHAINEIHENELFYIIKPEHK